MRVKIINQARKTFLESASDHVASTEHNASKIAMDYLNQCLDGIDDGDDWDLCKARVCGESTKESKLIRELVDMGFITNASKSEYYSRLWKGLYMVAFHEEGTEAKTLTAAKQEYEKLFPPTPKKASPAKSGAKLPKAVVAIEKQMHKALLDYAKTHSAKQTAEVARKMFNVINEAAA